LGVLGEKAKTTPDVYPMSLNGVVTGCNQKSNRSPLLSLEAEQVEEALDKLREFGAVTLVEGSGRVQKYKHHLYEWLGVDKVEMAVMIELLLRGPQTLGELRGRASRMEPIGDLNELRELLNSLREKGLILPLTPDGRGQIFTHALFQQRDLDEQRSQFANVLPASYEQDDRAATATFSSPAARTTNPANTTTTAASSSSNDSRLEKELGELRMQATQLQADLNDLTSRHEQLEAEVSRLRDALGG
jgi:uncharacterized protein YceH (UPF0502 family)